MRYRVAVDLATSRPPGVHRTVYWVVEAPRRHEATNEAIHWSLWTNRDAVMAVGSRTELVQEGYECDDEDDVNDQYAGWHATRERERLRRAE
jgi:hypothetical protein